MTTTASVFTLEMETRLGDLLTTFKLPTVSAQLAERLLKAGKADALPLVLEICELEAQDRHTRRVERLRKASELPPGKTFDTFKERLPKALMQKMQELSRGDFLERAANVLMFGLPGVGKSHAAAAIGHALVDRGHSVLFAPAYKIVQDCAATRPAQARRLRPAYSRRHRLRPAEP